MCEQLKAGGDRPRDLDWCEALAFLVCNDVRPWCFDVDHFRIQFCKHDTGRSASIVATLFDSTETLLVYNRNEWISSAYAFNNEGTLQGYRPGPWVGQLEDVRRQLVAEAYAFAREQERNAAQHRTARAAEEERKLDRFRAAFSVRQTPTVPPGTR